MSTTLDAPRPMTADAELSARTLQVFRATPKLLNACMAYDAWWSHWETCEQGCQPALGAMAGDAERCAHGDGLLRQANALKRYALAVALREVEV